MRRYLACSICIGMAAALLLAGGRVALALDTVNDRCTGGTITASGTSPGGEEKEKAFDDNTGSKWLTQAATGWIAYQFSGGQRFAITSYTITSGNDSPTRDPRNWTLEGSDDGVTWTVVDTRTGIGPWAARNTTYTYTCPGNMTGYRRYRLNVTLNNGDGLVQLSEIELFGPPSAPAGAASFGAWSRTCDIRIRGYAGNTPLTNFPALVVLSTNITGFSYRSFLSGANNDLRFTDGATTNELNYEIENWNTNGASYVWVRVPRVSGTNTTIRAYWGMAGVSAPAYRSGGAVWANGYETVWHMDGLADSSSSANTLVNSGTSAGTGAVGAGRVFSGASNYATAAVPAALGGGNPFTVSFWMNFTHRTSRQWLLDYGQRAAGAVHFLIGSDDGGQYGVWSTALQNSPNFSSYAGTWVHCTTTYRQSDYTLKTYLNGIEVSSSTGNSGSAPNVTASGGLRMGQTYNSEAYYQGSLDEVRLDSAARSPEWVRAAYLTMASNAAFTAYGSVRAFAGWARRMPVTFSGYTQSEPLTNFPALVKLDTGISGFSYTQFLSTAGTDLRFADAQTNDLCHQVDLWDTNGTSSVWVQVPRLTSNTTVYAYWGKAGQTAPAYTTNGATWSQGYVAVHHMRENPAGTAPQMRDSTAYANHGTAYNMSSGAQVTGPINGSLVLDGTDDYLRIDGVTGDMYNKDYSVFCWLRRNGTPGDADELICFNSSDGSANRIRFGIKSGTTKLRVDSNSSDVLTSTSTVTDNAWRYVGYTRKQSPADGRLYVNGVQEATTSSLTQVLSSTDLMAIGEEWDAGPAASDFLAGGVDEVRVSSVIRSTAWIWAEYVCAASNSAFAFRGPVEDTSFSPLPRVATAAATGIGQTTATLNGSLNSTGTSSTAVSVYWGTANGVTTAANWGHTNTWAAPRAAGTHATNLTGLASTTTYYYRFAAANASGTVWSASGESFTTKGPPVVNNDAGATNLIAGTVRLRGTLANDGGAATDVRTYWGASDGGTNRTAWQRSVTNLAQAIGSFQNTVSGLLYGQRYYYRCFGTNAYGGSWAGSSQSFVPNQTVAVAPVGGLLLRTYDTTYGTSYLNPIANLVAVTPSGTRTQTTTIAYTSVTPVPFVGSCPGITANDYLALLWTGWFNVSKDGTGTYTFGTSSDDGSVIYLDLNDDGDFADAGELIVNNNKDQGDTVVTGQATLNMSRVRIAIGYYQGGGGYAMQARFKKGSGLAWSALDPIVGTSGYFYISMGSQLTLSLVDAAATGIGLEQATLNGTLQASGAVYRVRAFWGPSNGGTTPSAWSRSADVGRFTNANPASLSYTAASLTNSTTYHFAFRATNDVSTLWATNVLSFTTKGPLSVNNASGAVALGVGTAGLAGRLVDDAGVAATVYVCWGTENGGTNRSAWQHVITRTGQAVGGFTNTLTGLYYGQRYYYRCQASNATAVVWAPSTETFLTRHPQYVPHGAGLLAGSLSGAFNTSGANPGTTHFLGPHAGATQSKPPWADSLTWVYTGQVYLNGGTYHWAENIDDSVLLKIDGTTYLNNSGWDTPTKSGDIVKSAGWHDIEIRLGNGTGGAGPVVGNGWTATKGFGYNVNGADSTQGGDYAYPEDPGNMTLFRYSTGGLADTPMTIVALPASDRTTTTATLNASLTATGAVYRVTAYWGLANAGTNAGIWSRSVACGTFTNANGLTVSGPATGLAMGTTYYCAFRMSNDVDVSWSTNVMTFRTAGPPIVDNHLGAAPVGSTYATLRGRLLNDGEAASEVRVYWGDNDGVTNAANWDHTNTFTSASEGTLTTNITGLVATTPYYYRFYATNVHGGSWAAASTNFIAAAYRNVYVSPSSPNEGAPYTTWDTAAHTLQKAVGYVSTNLATYDTIILADGRHTVTSMVTLAGGITIRGLGDPTNTIVCRTGATAFRVFSLTHSGALLTGLTITNGLYSRGCGVWMNAGTVSNCIVRRNASSDGYGDRPYGAGVYMEGGLLTHSTIERNTLSANHGGGAGLYLKNNARAVLCRIERNSNYVTDQAEGGGAVSLRDTAVLESCLVVNNATTDTSWRGASQAAVLIDGGTAARVRNCTIANNTNAAHALAGLAMTGGKAENTIVWGNTTTVVGQEPVQVGQGQIDGGGTYDAVANCSYSCALELTSGTGNRTDDPLLDSGFALRAPSPCRDVGTNGNLTVSVDLAGNPRIAEGVVDLGCYEFTSAGMPLSGDFVADATEGHGSLDVTFTATFAGANTNLASMEWNFGAGWVSGDTTEAHTFGLGRHTVAMRASNTDVPADTVEVTYTNLITVYAFTNYVSRTGTHVYPYTSWATAATNLQAAIDAGGYAAGVRTVVLVTNGSYGVTTPVLLNRGVAVRSLGGPGSATVYRSGAAACRVFSIDDANAVLAGFTITNGLYSRGCGVAMVAGTVSNCVIRGNASRDGYNNNERTYGAGVFMEGGLLTHSTLRANSLVGNHGGSAALYLSNGARALVCRIECNTNNVGDQSQGGAVSLRDTAVLESCLVVSNANISGIFPTRGLSRAAVFIDGSGNARIRNCTITGNRNASAGLAGLAMNAGQAENTIVWGNYTTASGYTSAQVGNGDGGSVGITTVCSYSCAPELTAGTANQTSDPLLAADFSLRPASTCRDAGTAASLTVTTDLAGAARVLGAAVDLGCFEFDASSIAFTGDFAADATEGFGSLDVTFTATFAGGNTNLATCEWDFGAGWVSGSPTIAHTFGLGRHTVGLRATNTEDPAGSTQAIYTNLITVYAFTNYVSPTGSHSYPFATWGTAATNLQDAVDAAGVVGATRSVVLLAGGRFPVSHVVTVDKAITIRGEQGPALTTVCRSGAGAYRVFEVTAIGAVLSGVTITNGYNNFDNSGSAIYLSAGTVSNCVIRRNVSDIGRGAVVMTGGNSLLTHSTIEDNRTAAWHASGGAIRAESYSRIRNCTVRRNSMSSSDQNTGFAIAASDGVMIDNCLVANNTNAVGGNAGQPGGAVYLWASTLRGSTVAANSDYRVSAGVYADWGTLRNCIVYGNRGGGADYFGSNATIAYSCAPDLTNGVGNVAADPALQPDLSLGRGSPCINAGDNAAVTVPLDLAGRPRIVSQTVDMGCYERPFDTGTALLVR